ncbi:cyclase family protein [Niastella sp. OAS944]|uniref:cyclase family protein n=1 Tax=Niastella sp. OAS944 TaxID=2664089 RepID=UPI0034875200|nr:kynurenine formamidase [Chitinophagaceae bacterium OAS944]
MKRKISGINMLLFLFSYGVNAQETAGKSPWGPNDEIGTLNMMSGQSQLQALRSVKLGKTYDLSVPYYVGMPGFNIFGDPQYQYWLTHTPHGTLVDNPNGQGESMNKKISYTSDAISMFTHTGTHIDALSHFGLEGKIWNGFSAEKYLGDKGWKKGSAETIPPIIARGVLIDMAAFKGKSVLDQNYRITVEDLRGALKKQEIKLAEGDVVLIRTGMAKFFQEGNKYLDQYAGISLAAVKWLVEDQKVMTMGADNLSLEMFPPEQEGNWVPVHTYLLAQKGVMFIENMFLEELATDKVYEFAFIAASLKLRGATGAPVRPLALPFAK